MTDPKPKRNPLNPLTRQGYGHGWPHGQTDGTGSTGTAKHHTVLHTVLCAGLTQRWRAGLTQGVDLTRSCTPHTELWCKPHKVVKCSPWKDLIAWRLFM